MVKKIYLVLILALVAGALVPQSASAEVYLTDGSSTQGDIYYGETAGQTAYRSNSTVMAPLAVRETVHVDTSVLKDNKKSVVGFFSWLLSIL